MYPHPLDVYRARCLGYREQCLRRFSAAVREKLNWTEKILDRKLFAQWLREAAHADNTHLSDYDIYDSQRIDVNIITWNKDDVEFVYNELVKGYKPYVETLREHGQGVEPDIDSVWRADAFIDEGLREKLIAGSSTLETAVRPEVFGNPRYPQKVYDLVDPSLWPIIYGKTLSSLDGKPIQPPGPPLKSQGNRLGWHSRGADEAKLWSTQFCWLPSEFEIKDNGETKIASYINNLTLPDQKMLLYPTIEKIFAKFVPLFNHVLADLSSGKHNKVRTMPPTPFDFENKPLFVNRMTKKQHTDRWEELLGQFEGGEELTVEFPLRKPTEGPCPWPEDAQPSDSIVEIWDLGRVLRDERWEPPLITDGIKLEGRKIKVILRSTNVQLGPRNAFYDGGRWHVQGMKNERIVAIGIYCYDQENTTEGKISFRRLILESSVGDAETNWLEAHNFNSNGEIWVQGLGETKIEKNRAIAFPNIFQSRMTPIQLVDQTKTGYRKLLIFYLCDPDHDMPTSRTVAAQQPESRSELEEALRNCSLGELPEEIFCSIVNHITPAISADEAAAYRERIIGERNQFSHNSPGVGRSYDLCNYYLTTTKFYSTTSITTT